MFRKNVNRCVNRNVSGKIGWRISGSILVFLSLVVLVIGMVMMVGVVSGQTQEEFEKEINDNIIDGSFKPELLDNIESVKDFKVNSDVTNGQLVNAWNKIKVEGESTPEKVDKADGYKKKFLEMLKAQDGTGKKADFFISELIKTKFTGSENLGEKFEVKGNRIIAEIDESGDSRAEIPLEGISGIEKIELVEFKGLEGEEKGLATFYYPNSNNNRQLAVLTKGVFKNDESGRLNIVENGKDIVGNIEIRDNSQAAVFFHGALSDRVQHLPGEDGIIFTNKDGVRISGSDRDVTTDDGFLVGYSGKEDGFRGSAKKDGFEVSVIHERDVSVNLNGNILGNKENENMVKVGEDFFGNVVWDVEGDAKNVEVNYDGKNIAKFERGEKPELAVIENAPGKPVKNIGVKPVLAGDSGEPEEVIDVSESLKNVEEIMVKQIFVDRASASADVTNEIPSADQVLNNREPSGEQAGLGRVTSFNDEKETAEVVEEELEVVDEPKVDDDQVLPDIIGGDSTDKSIEGKADEKTIGDVEKSVDNINKELKGGKGGNSPIDKAKDYFSIERSITRRVGEGTGWTGTGRRGTSSKGEGYFSTNLGNFGSGRIDYITGKKLKELANNKRVTVTITSPTVCGPCVRELNGMSQRERNSRIFLLPVQAKELKINYGGSIPSTITYTSR